MTGRKAGKERIDYYLGRKIIGGGGMIALSREIYISLKGETILFDFVRDIIIRWDVKYGW